MTALTGTAAGGMGAGFAFLALGYVLSQFFRAFLAVLAPTLEAEVGATAADLALASGIWFATFAAMQVALARLLDDLSPEAIAKKLPPSSFASKKTRAWDALVATWRAKEEAHENGLLDIFLTYFSEAYAKAAKQKPPGKS